MSRIFTISVGSVYPHYVTKVEKKGRTKAELDRVIQWLTGFDSSALSGHLAAGRGWTRSCGRSAGTPWCPAWDSSTD